MRKFVFLFFAFAWVVSGFGQSSTGRTHFFRHGKSTTVNVSEAGNDYFPRLQNLEAPAPGGESYKAWLRAYKQELYEDYVPTGRVSAKTRATAPAPNINRNFEGNLGFDGTPSDNHGCVSNGGIVISAINSNVHMFDGNGGLLQNISLYNLSGNLGLTTDMFDPRCFYDPNEDRFVLCWLHSRTDTTNNIVVAFSQTNDPTGNWNLYALPGNPLVNRTWTDYPMIALTEHEVFITGNAIWQDSTSWQTGFSETYIWQIRKQDGYNGDSLTVALHDSIDFGGKSIRNLCPVKGGSGLPGPNMYFLSERNFDASNDTFFIVEVTDTIGAAGAQVTIDYIRSGLAYGMPPDGRQRFNQILATNDSRVLDAFIENNMVQFVQNTLDPSTGFCGIYHGIIPDITGSLNMSGHIIGDSLLDFGYPGISYSGLQAGDLDAVITMNYTGPDADKYAGFGAVYFDGIADYSEFVTIKTGDNFINVINGVFERWGDYSGSQRKYNEPGVIWTMGGWGKTNRTSGTWITEIFHPTIASRPEPTQPHAVTWPNPALDMVNVEFELTSGAPLQFHMTDMQGRKVFEMEANRVKSGKNKFSFATRDLENGLYVLRIQQGNLLITTQKVVVER